ncbi:MAG: flagellar assembly protein FliW [Magnetococcus sp. WYHC-3]
MRTLEGTRFGTLDYDPSEVIVLEDGLLGFPRSRRYLLFPYGRESPFFWLQSVDEAELAFIVINPFEFFTGLEYTIRDEDSAALGLSRADEMELFTLVTIPAGHPELTGTNLSAPVVVNVKNRMGRQVIMEEYASRQLLVPENYRYHPLGEWTQAAVDARQVM